MEYVHKNADVVTHFIMCSNRVHFTAMLINNAKFGLAEQRAFAVSFDNVDYLGLGVALRSVCEGYSSAQVGNELTLNLVDCENEPKLVEITFNKDPERTVKLPTVAAYWLAYALGTMYPVDSDDDLDDVDYLIP